MDNAVQGNNSIANSPETQRTNTPQPILDNQPTITPNSATNISQPNNNKPDQAKDEEKAKKKGGGFIKFIRVLIWFAVANGLTIGLSIYKSSFTSSSYINRTDDILRTAGQSIATIFGILGLVNLIWGCARWLARYKKEKWSIGKIIGKIIGGGIWRFMVITPIVTCALFVIAPTIKNSINNDTYSIIETYASSAYLIKNDYQKGLITADDYVKYRLMSAYDKDNLPAHYYSTQHEMSAHEELLSFVKENYQSLKAETIQSVAEATLFQNIDFGDEEEAKQSNVSTRKAFLFGNNALAKAKKITILEKAIMSPNHKFIIFYTNYGDDAIDNEKATKIGELLEKIVNGYKDNLNLEYSYSPIYHNESAKKKVEKLLVQNNIEANTIETAMPVYVVNPYGTSSNTLATYAGKAWSQLADWLLNIYAPTLNHNSDEYKTIKLYTSTPSYPFINIQPQADIDIDLPLITAHELGHHYSTEFCSKHHNGDSCNANDFIKETLPNYSAIRAMPEQSLDNIINEDHYNYSYLGSGTNVKISEASPGFTGYPAFTFLINYSETVPNGQNIIFESAYQDDALAYLHEQASEDAFKHAMMQTTERNVIGYDKKYSISPQASLNVEKNPCYDLCKVTRDIASMSSRYYYFSPQDYSDTDFSFIGEDGVEASLLAKEGNEWTIIENGKKIEFKLTKKNKYDVFVLAITNYDYANDKTYELGISTNKLNEIVDESQEEDDEATSEQIPEGCIEFELMDLLELSENLIEIGDTFVNEIESSGDASEYSEEIDQWRNESDEAKKEINDAKNEIGNYHISICTNKIKNDIDFENAKKTIKKSVDDLWDVFNHEENGQRIHISIGTNLLTRQVKAFVLYNENSETYLLTINAQEN